LVVAVVIAVASPANAQRVKSDQDTLIELEQKWDVAFRNRDATFIETLLADDFVVTYEDGTRGDKAKELSLAAGFNQHMAKPVTPRELISAVAALAGRAVPAQN